MTTHVRAERPLFARTIDLYLAEEKEFGMFVAQPLELKETPDGERAAPFLRLRETEAQSLIDELWQCGLRPSEGTGSAGSLAATERHLKDMQSIALGLLRKDGVQV